MGLTGAANNVVDWRSYTIPEESTPVPYTLNTGTFV